MGCSGSVSECTPGMGKVKLDPHTARRNSIFLTLREDTIHWAREWLAAQSYTHSRDS